MALDWIRSYLTNRTQYVEFNECYSTRQNIICGVPQGSILDPLLFLLYINDITMCSKVLYFILYAHDTNLFYSDTNLACLVDTVNIELENLADWFRANKLLKYQ